MHVDNVGAHAIQEVLGMGDHEQGALEVLQLLLQPHAGLQGGERGGDAPEIPRYSSIKPLFEVQVTCWLVEDGQGGLNQMIT